MSQVRADDSTAPESECITAPGHHLVELDAIRDHYDRLSPLYHRFWGEHIHHGFWENGETLPEAQLKLIARLATAARIPQGARVLDVGCGLGGSALWLAREQGCSVHGITLSAVQVESAARRARATGLDRRVRFEVHDANRLQVEPESYDVVWSIECTEHLFDKPRFVAQAARGLKPGGALAVCAWLAQSQSAEHRALIRDVCRGMLCPSLGSRNDYLGWLRTAGLEIVHADDITRNVEPTWDRASVMLARPEIQALLKVSGRATREFARAFSSIRQAYAVGAMAYGLFAASKPMASRDASA